MNEYLPPFESQKPEHEPTAEVSSSGALSMEPIDDFEGLELALSAIALQHLNLSPEQQFDLALITANSFKLLENADRKIADLRQLRDKVLS